MSSRRILAGLLVGLCVILPGCSTVKAIQQPEKKDMAVLNQGTPRARVIAELGKPLMTESKQGNHVDVFKFRQGYSKGLKAARALGHGVADVMTLGLWEVVGTPIEGAANGRVNEVQVIYDRQDRVRRVIALKGRDVRKKSTT